MHAFTAVAAILATSVAAAPANKRQVSGINPGVIFTNASCTISQSLLGYPALGGAFPTATTIGTVIGPLLNNLIGANGVNDLDLTAENLCISANQDPADGTGVCQNALDLLFDFATSTSQGQALADQFGCLLNALCIAQNSPQNFGLCQDLLAGSDCIANRIVGVDPAGVECLGNYPA